MNARVLLVLIALLGLLAGCTNHRAWTTQDSWYTGLPSEDTSLWEWQVLEQARIHEVIESKHPDAEDLLDNIPVVEITEKAATDFIGRVLPEEPGTKPYLVRGVYLNRPTGRFFVYVLENRLIVHHGCLGRYPFPMKRQALVLQLTVQPGEVFVSCSMDE